MKEEQKKTYHQKKYCKYLLIIVVLLIAAALFFIISGLIRGYGSGIQKQNLHNVIQDSSTNKKTASNKTESSDWTFQEILLPTYVKDFLSDHWETDYRNVISALYAGKSSVQLTSISTQQEWEELCRPVRLTFPPNALLFDAHYYNSQGPFSFDEATKILTIRYGWEEETPSVTSRSDYLKKIKDFKINVTKIFDLYITDVSNEEKTAGELYDYVASALRYDYDMKLDLYDAFTEGTAYCATYSEMYQYLMWQAGYECWLWGGGNYDHEWNVILLDGSAYHVDTTWESTGDSPKRYFFAMSDSTAEKTGHGPSANYTRTDALLDTVKLPPTYCTNQRFDQIYRKELLE